MPSATGLCRCASRLRRATGPSGTGFRGWPSDFQQSNLDALGLSARLDATAISALVGAAKPDPRMFGHAGLEARDPRVRGRDVQQDHVRSPEEHDAHWRVPPRVLQKNVGLGDSDYTALIAALTGSSSAG